MDDSFAMLTCFFLPLCADPDLQLFCSAQLKLLQLYSDIQQLHEAPNSPAPPSKVQGNTHACKRTQYRDHVYGIFSGISMLKLVKALCVSTGRSSEKPVEGDVAPPEAG